MNTTSFTSCRQCRFALFLALFLVPVSPPAVHADESPSAGTARTVCLAVTDGSSVLVGGVWKGFISFLENSLNNRRRMIQFAVLGMCLALYIMIWRR